MADVNIYGHVFFLFSVLLVHQSGSQEILFELKKGEFQEIRFHGDTNVSMICQVRGILAVEITITQNGTRIIASKAGTGSCLEYIIPVVESNDGGNYECSVKYLDVGNGFKTLQKVLTLNVSGGNSSCFRNGTKEPYKLGDTLLLSCYCKVAEFCVWTASVVGSQLGTPIQPFTQVEQNNIKISTINIGPLNSSDLNVRYDCSHGSTVSERCSIGPAGKSSHDLVLSPTASSNMILECDETVIKIIPSTTDDGTVISIGGNVPGSDDIGPTLFLLIPIMGVLCLLLVIIIFISLSIYKSKKVRRTKSADKRILAVDEPSPKTDGFVYGTETTDEYANRFRNDNVGQETYRVAKRVDDRDIGRHYGLQEQTGLRYHNSAYVDDVSYADQFQSAETSDYHVPQALMKRSYQKEDDHLYAEL